MPERIGKKCPQGEVWIDSGRNAGCWPKPPPKMEITFFGCGRTFAAVEDEDGRRYCSPCQTIEFSCPDTGSEVSKRELCPHEDEKYVEKYGTHPPEKDVYLDAQYAILDLYDRGCVIKTRGEFQYILQSWRHAPKGQVKGKVSLFCKTQHDESFIESEVSIPHIIGEPAEKTKGRFEEGARKMAGQIDGCQRIEDVKIASEWAYGKAAQEGPKQSSSSNLALQGEDNTQRCAEVPTK